MAGMKQAILNDTPISFWTFDYDQQFKNNDLIVDEIGNRNPMHCMDDIAGPNYVLEQQSLIPLESNDQHSIVICRDGKVNGAWRNQYFEVPDNDDYNFPNLGQFSIEFVYYKTPASTEIRTYGEPGYASDVTTPLIRKGSMIRCWLNDDWSSYSTERLYVNFLGRQIDLYYADYPIFNSTNHVVITYDVKQTDVNEYKSTISLYVNGRLRGSNTQTHIDNLPVTNVIDSWLIAGNAGNNAAKDFASEFLKMDNIAIYDYALTEFQVANHWRKMHTYDDMIKREQVNRYWRLKEFHNPADPTIYNEVGGINGTYHGAVTRGEPGPANLVTAYSPYFQVGGLGYIDHYETGDNNEFEEILETDDSWTLEFWFKSASTKRGMMFDSSQEAPPRWDGLRVYLNAKDNVNSPGKVQVSVTNTGWVNSQDVNPEGQPYLFNDGQWHHLCVRYTKSTQALDLFLDGALHNTTYTSCYWIDKPAQITLMNARPGDMALDGNLSEIAFYKYPLQDMQIHNRWNFTTPYRVQGFTLLQGSPVKARVRFYDTITGELLHQTDSNPATGEYRYYPSTNRLLDIVCQLPELTTTRYRVHGPVKPAEYEDNHVIEV